MNDSTTGVLRERAFSRLTSRDPDVFWTSGQWMTERKGGSDVGEFIHCLGFYNTTFH